MFTRDRGLDGGEAKRLEANGRRGVGPSDVIAHSGTLRRPVPRAHRPGQRDQLLVLGIHEAELTDLSGRSRAVRLLSA